MYEQKEKGKTKGVKTKGGKTKGILTETQIEKLEEVDWNNAIKYSYNSHSWSVNYELLKNYKKEFKEFPKWITEYKGVKIGNWVGGQAKMKRKLDSTPEDAVAVDRNGKYSTLKARVAKLKNIGIDFE